MAAGGPLRRTRATRSPRATPRRPRRDLRRAGAFRAPFRRREPASHRLPPTVGMVCARVWKGDVSKVQQRTDGPTGALGAALVAVSDPAEAATAGCLDADQVARAHVTRHLC